MHPKAVDPATIRDWDRRTIDEFGLPGIALMETAGARAALRIARLVEAEPEAFPPRFWIVAGRGNNGGDGFVVARHLANAGYPVTVVLAVERGEIHRESDAGLALGVLDAMESIDRRFLASSDSAAPPAECGAWTIVDALFGTGLSRPIESPWREWIEQLTGSGLPSIAIDVPSGLDARSGEVLGACLPAAATLTFAAPKLGFFRGAGPQLTGRIWALDIGLPRHLWDPDDSSPAFRRGSFEETADG